jgi:hypothetical protein
VHPAWLIGGENVPINMRLSLPAPPSDLKKHVRYHEDFFHIQALMYRAHYMGWAEVRLRAFGKWVRTSGGLY